MNARRRAGCASSTRSRLSCSAGQPLADAEVIHLGHMILDALGVAGDCTLHLNSLGDAASRQAYREALVAYLAGYRDSFPKTAAAALR